MIDSPRKYNQLLILIGVSVFLFVVDLIGLLGWAHRIFDNSTTSLRAGIVEKKAGLASPISKDLESEREILACQLKVDKLREENSSARRLLGVKLPPGEKYEPARVLGTSKEGLELDIGSDIGIENGAAVLSDGVLVGRVTDLGLSRSRVDLLTSSETKMLVGIWSERDFDGEGQPIVKGILRGGSSLVIEEITSDEKINEGDLVASLDFGGIYLVGRIKKVWMTDDDLFKKGLVDWLVDPDRLITVFVAK